MHYKAIQNSREALQKRQGTIRPQVVPRHIIARCELNPQPQTSLRFHTPTKSTRPHAIWAHRTVNSDYFYPCIQASVPPFLKNPGRLFVLLTLHQPIAENSKNNRENNIYELSPHFLLKKELVEKNLKKKQYHGCGIIFEEMRCDSRMKYFFTFDLKDYYIERQPLADHDNIIQKKQENLMKFLYGTLRMNNFNIGQSIPARHAKHRVYLGYTIFRILNLSMDCEHYMGPFYTNTILNKNHLLVHKLCNTHGSIDGGDEITVLVSFFDKTHMYVHIFEKNEHGNITWRCQASVTEVLDNTLVSFELPKYAGKWLGDYMAVRECAIEIVDELHKDKSEPVKFFYVNDSDDPQHSHIDLKQKNHNNCQVHSSKLIAANRAEHDEIPFEWAIKRLENIIKGKGKRMLKKIRNLNNRFERNHPYGNSIFHEMIKNDELLKLQELTEEQEFTSILLKVKNDRQETLSHYACKFNKPNCLHTLMRMGCTLHAQDFKGRTPLHIAIVRNHQDAIMIFAQLLEKINTYKQAADELPRLFTIYNRHGHTVLHQAILMRMSYFIDRVISYCLRQSIDISKYVVLGNGETILHLAIKTNQWDVATHIANNICRICFYESFRGDNVSDMKSNADSNMFNLIKYIEICNFMAWRY